MAIIGLLDGTEATPAEIRAQLPAEHSQQTVAYHLAVLERDETIERIGGVYRRKVARR